MKTATEYINEIYGARDFDRTVKVMDDQSIIDLMQDFSDYNMKSFTDQKNTYSDQQLLDHFAGLAMQGFISKYGNDGAYNSLAEMSYQVADAMLKARKEANNENYLQRI